jgi:hypothetical protein
MGVRGCIWRAKETVIESLKDAEDYTAFEMSITSSFDVQSAVEREIVLRLASVMWRLRRSTAIETGCSKLTVRKYPRASKPNGDLFSSLMQALRNGCVYSECPFEIGMSGSGHARWIK